MVIFTLINIYILLLTLIITIILIFINLLRK